MSKNIAIQEGGVAKQLTVDKLKTNLVNSGTCLWVPEDEVQLISKTITENGSYKAIDDGGYGYSEVIVNVANAGIATGTDGDGDEAVAYTDPTTGGLVEEKVPSSIEVITPPTNPYGIYTNGQTIGTEGMVVKAYLQTGSEYGTVPNGEITLNPTIAVYDASTDTPGGYDITTDLELNPNVVQPFLASPSVHVTNPNVQPHEFNIIFKSGSGLMVSYKESNNSSIVLLATSDSSATFGSDDSPFAAGFTSFIEYDGKRAYYTTYGLAGSGFQASNDCCGGQYTYMNTSQQRNLAWAMLYGDREEVHAGSRQTITVSWPRPLDGKVLETTFEILVAPPYSTEE